jgi:hypothetical protein
MIAAVHPTHSGCEFLPLRLLVGWGGFKRFLDGSLIYPYGLFWAPSGAQILKITLIGAFSGRAYRRELPPQDPLLAFTQPPRLYPHWCFGN